VLYYYYRYVILLLYYAGFFGHFTFLQWGHLAIYGKCPHCRNVKWPKNPRINTHWWKMFVRQWRKAVA